MLYDLTFVIEGADLTDDDMVAALAEELDASLARGAGVDLLLITAEGTSAVNAAQNAMRSVQYLAPQIKFQYLDRDLVGISEIAERTGRSRQNITQWVNGERHAANSTPFPKVEGVVGRARIWLWSEVNAWLHMLGLGDEIPSPRRHEITDIDFLIRHRDWLTRNYPTVGIVWPSVYLERYQVLTPPAVGSNAMITSGAETHNFFISISTTYARADATAQTGERWVTSQVLGIPS